jgi:histidyl-tRNA synthetase
LLQSCRQFGPAVTQPSITLAPPRGMRDFYPADTARRDAIFAAWRAAARRFGFEPYDACVVESLDLLKRKAGEEIVDQIYTFRDKSGRDLALRPEMTPTLARMVAARRGALSFPLKWTTVAQCFRYERTTRGRKREHYQWNLDIIGEDSVAAELEVIAAAVDAMLALGLPRSAFRVHVSSRALLGDLLAELGIAPGHHAAVFLALDKLGKLDDAAIRAMLVDAGLDAAAVARVFTLLAVADLDDAAARFRRPPESLARLRTLFAWAGTAGIADCLVFDLRVVRGLAYYTGIVFEAFDRARALRALFGGGRYDNLLGEIGGTPLTGVGLGFGDVVIAELLDEEGVTFGADRAALLALGFMEEAQREAALRLAAALRSGGQAVELALRPEKAKAFFTRTGKGGYSEAVYLGPDDVTTGTARVKNLATRAEREISLPD